MRTTCSLVSLLFAAAAASQTVDDIGLKVAPTSNLPAMVGQECGPVTCTALPAGTVTRGTSVTLLHQSAAVTPFAIAVAQPGPCTVVPGIANPLLLGAGLEILTVSVTSAPPFRALQCDQGLAILQLIVPNTLPAGLQLRLQSLGWSIQGVPGFGPALDVTVQ